MMTFALQEGVSVCGIPKGQRSSLFTDSSCTAWVVFNVHMNVLKNCFYGMS